MLCVCRWFNLLNGTRDRYEIWHTGRLGKYKTKLLNTFFDLVTSGHTWSQVTIIALLYYCNGTRDRYEIRHTGRLGKYKTKLVNTFFDLVTSGHTWSQVTIIALLYYCNGTRDHYEIRHTGRVSKYKTKLVNTFFDLVTPGHTWSYLVTPGHKMHFYETFIGVGWSSAGTEKSARRATLLLVIVR